MSPEFQRPRWKRGGSGRKLDGPEHYSSSQAYEYQTDVSEKDFPTSVVEYIAPAIDGPPSPERLRQLTTQMKRAYHLQRRAPVIQGPKAGSSAASSVAPVAPDYHPWEQPNDYYYLNRRPSQRSTGSSTPSRERPESIFGRSIFLRKGRLTRDSGIHSSSGAFSASGDPSGDGISGLKDALMPMFSRRKPSRDETAVQRKLQISTPFNFQHVAHTDKSNVDDRDRSSMDLPYERHVTRTPDLSSALGGLSGLEISDSSFHNAMASNTRSQTPDAPQVSQQPFRPTLVPRHTAPSPGVRRFPLKLAESQDLLQTSPARQTVTPSPTEARDVSPPLPPVPLRLSSKQSKLSDEASVTFHPLGSTPLERPSTSTGFRKPRPFSPIEQVESASAVSFQSDGARDEEDLRLKQAVSTSPSPSPTPDDVRHLAGSPSTPSFEKALPDVPEEEEYQHVAQQGRVSVVSNSSLRGSHSVPMLRSPLLPASTGSDTLGPHDAMTGRRATMIQTTAADAGRGAIVNSRESWEDDIDYAYEHEVEADCDYQWSRSSLDASRQSNRHDDELAEIPTNENSPEPQVLAPSPTTSTSSANVRDTITSVYAQPLLHQQQPTAVVSNFSYNRLSVKRIARSNSNASSYKESQGYTVSPSMLVPIDYREYMASLSDEPETSSPEPQHRPHHHRRYPSHDISAPLKSLEHRSSTSTTTESIGDSRSDSTGERHASANSACTCLTGPTASSTSLNKLSEFDFETHNQQHMEHDQTQQTTPNATVTKLVDAYDGRNTAYGNGAYGVALSPEADTVPELTRFIPPRGKSLHKTHASESMVAATAARPDVPHMKSFEGRAKRARSRAASLNQAPPVGQYALFPRGQVKATGDLI